MRTVFGWVATGGLVLVLMLAVQGRTIAVRTTIPTALGFAYSPELSIAQPPLQQLYTSPQSVRIYKNYRITPIASFQMQALLVHKKRYRYGGATDISPIDMMLSWGILGEEVAWEGTEIRQHSRRGVVQPDSNAWYENPERTNSWANMHMLPASVEVYQSLLRADAGQQIRLKGFLVNVIGGDEWITSTSREDDDCEIVLVDSFEVL